LKEIFHWNKKKEKNYSPPSVKKKETSGGKFAN
jgi:hypothetical protein